MRKIKKLVSSFLEYGLIISFISMMLVVMIQVIARFMLPKAPAWTEEAARFFFIFSISLGGGLGIRDHAFVRLEWLINSVSPSYQKHLNVLIYSLIAIFSITVAYYTIDFVEVGKVETSPALFIPMNYIFSGILFLFIFIALFSVEEVFNLFKNSNK